MTRPDVLPSTIYTVSAPRIGNFRGSMAGLCAPLSTLRRGPHGQPGMTRGRCGSLLLHRKGLAPSTPCRSPGAYPETSLAAARIKAKEHRITLSEGKIPQSGKKAAQEARQVEAAALMTLGAACDEFIA